MNNEKIKKLRKQIKNLEDELKEEMAISFPAEDIYYLPTRWIKNKKFDCMVSNYCGFNPDGTYLIDADSDFESMFKDLCEVVEIPMQEIIKDLMARRSWPPAELTGQNLDDQECRDYTWNKETSSWEED